jgi:hypothetical protein
MNPMHYAGRAISLMGWEENTLKGAYNHEQIRACDTFWKGMFLNVDGGCDRRCSRQDELDRIAAMREKLYHLSIEAETSLAERDEVRNALALEQIRKTSQTMLLAMNNMAKNCYHCQQKEESLTTSQT